MKNAFLSCPLLLAPCLAAPSSAPAPSHFLPQELQRRLKEYSFAFQLPFWLRAETLLLIHSQSVFPFYLMKYTDFPAQMDVVDFVVWVVFCCGCYYLVGFFGTRDFVDSKCLVL